MLATDVFCEAVFLRFTGRAATLYQAGFGQAPSCFHVQYNPVAPTFRFVPTDNEEFALLPDPTFRNRTVFNSSRNAAMCSTGTVDSILVPGLGFLVTWGVALRAARTDVYTGLVPRGVIGGCVV